MQYYNFTVACICELRYYANWGGVWMRSFVVVWVGSLHGETEEQYLMRGWKRQIIVPNWLGWLIITMFCVCLVFPISSMGC